MSTEQQPMPVDLAEGAWCWVRFDSLNGPTGWMPARRDGNCMESPGWRTPNVLAYGPQITVGNTAIHPDHEDHVQEIAIRLRRVARAAGRPNCVPDDDTLAVGAIFTVLGSIAGALEGQAAHAQPTPSQALAALIDEADSLGLYAATPPAQPETDRLGPYDAVARAMDMASLLAGSVAMNDTFKSEAYSSRLRSHLVKYMFPNSEEVLRRDLARSHESANSLIEQIGLLNQEVRELKAFRAMVNRHRPEFPSEPDGPRDIWYWQGDHMDHLESMVHTLPIVIRAEQLRELFAANAGAQPAPAWMPIETAPKDGTNVLLYMRESTRSKVREASWATPWDGAPDDQCYWMTPIGPAGRGYIILPSAVSHWMHLPAAPLPDSPQEQEP